MNLNNIKNIFKREKKVLTDEEKRKKAIITLLAYVAFFVFVMLFSMLSKGPDNTNSNNKPVDTVEDISLLYEEIKNNNFEGEINITGDSDIILVRFQRDSLDKELISKTYREKVSNYLRIGNNHYEINLDEGKYSKKENIKIYNNYDTTFLNVVNVLKLIEGIQKTDLKEESYNIARYKLSLIKALEVYNEINGTNYSIEADEEYIIDVNYSSDIEKIIIDMTKIHNIVKNTTYNKLTYTITFSSIGKVDLSTINEKNL